MHVYINVAQNPALTSASIQNKKRRRRRQVLSPYTTTSPVEDNRTTMVLPKQIITLELRDKTPLTSLQHLGLDRHTILQTT